MHIRTRGVSILIAVAITLPPAMLRAGETAVLTLEEAISLAIDNNGTLQASALEVRKAQDKLAAHRTRLYPSFSLYALGAQQLRSFTYTLDKGILGNYATTGPLPAEDVQLKTPLQPTGLITARVAQPLTSLIRIRRNLEALDTGVKLAREQTRSDQQKTIREVRRIYFGLQQVDASLRSIRETRGLYQEVESLTSNYVLQKVALRGDLLDAQVRVAKARQAEAQLLNQQASAKEQLNRLMGREISAEFEVQAVSDAVERIEISMEDARAQAIERRPEIRHAALRTLQAEQDLRAKKAEYLPDVSIEVNNAQFLNWGRFMPTQSLSAGVSLTWEPFDWNRKKHEAAEKVRSIQQARTMRRDTENSVLAEVNDKFRQLQYRRGELAVARLTQQAATENLRVANNRYRLQAALLKDVLQAQSSLEQTNAEYQQALTSFWDARADFARAIGEDR